MGALGACATSVTQNSLRNAPKHFIFTQRRKSLSPAPDPLPLGKHPSHTSSLNALYTQILATPLTVHQRIISFCGDYDDNNDDDEVIIKLSVCVEF